MLGGAQEVALHSFVPVRGHAPVSGDRDRGQHVCLLSVVCCLCRLSVSGCVVCGLLSVWLCGCVTVCVLGCECEVLSRLTPRHGRWITRRLLAFVAPCPCMSMPSQVTTCSESLSQCLCILRIPFPQVLDEEYDQALHVQPDRCRPLAWALGDRRSAAECKADFQAEFGTTIRDMMTSEDGRAMMARFTAVVQTRFEEVVAQTMSGQQDDRGRGFQRWGFDATGAVAGVVEMDGGGEEGGVHSEGRGTAGTIFEVPHAGEWGGAGGQTASSFEPAEAQLGQAAPLPPDPFANDAPLLS